MIDEAKETAAWKLLRELLERARQLPSRGRDEWVDDADMFSIAAFNEPDFTTPEGKTVELLLSIAEAARALADGAEGVAR